MRWNVAGLLKGPVGDTRQYSETEDLAELDEGVPATAPLTGQVRLTRTDRGILVDAHLRTRVKLTCGRCVKEFEQDLPIDFTEEFMSTVDVDTGLPVAVEDPEAFTIEEDHVLDLGEAVRQYGLLNLPIQAICRADCAGLCPVCGKDRNEGQCGCDLSEDDPRLAKLAELLDEGDVPEHPSI